MSIFGRREASSQRPSCIGKWDVCRRLDDGSRMSRGAHVRLCKGLGVKITRPTHPYILMRKGFLYLVAIMDWHSRKVFSWRFSNTMDTDFCVAALEEALAEHGKSDIFNTDKASQFTSFAFTDVLRENGIRISMDGRGRWLDNAFIERLWRSLKYECVYLNAFETGSEARAGIERGIDFYNRLRPHTALAGITPDMCHEQNILKAA